MSLRAGTLKLCSWPSKEETARPTLSTCTMIPLYHLLGRLTPSYTDSRPQPIILTLFGPPLDAPTFSHTTPPLQAPNLLSYLVPWAMRPNLLFISHWDSQAGTLTHPLSHGVPRTMRPAYSSSYPMCLSCGCPNLLSLSNLRNRRNSGGLDTFSVEPYTQLSILCAYLEYILYSFKFLEV